MSEPATVNYTDAPDLLTPGYLPLDKFVVDESISGRKRPRTAKQIRDKAESLMTCGQITAVKFECIPGDREHVRLTKGFGRYHAMQLLLSEGRVWPGGPLVKAEIEDAPTEVQRDEHVDAFVTGLHENIHRDKLTPADMWTNFQRLAAEPYNWDGRTIARRLNLSPGMVSLIRSIYTRTVPAVQRAVDAGVVPLREVRRFLDKSEPEQLALLRRYEDGSTRKKPAAEVKQETAAQARAHRLPPLERYRQQGRCKPLRTLLQNVDRYLTMRVPEKLTKRQQAVLKRAGRTMSEQIELLNAALAPADSTVKSVANKQRKPGEVSRIVASVLWPAIGKRQAAGRS